MPTPLFNINPIVAQLVVLYVKLDTMDALAAKVAPLEAQNRIGLCCRENIGSSENKLLNSHSFLHIGKGRENIGLSRIL